MAGKLHKTGTAFVTLGENRLGFVQVANQKIFRKPLFDTFSYPVPKPSISNPLKMNGYILHPYTIIYASTTLATVPPKVASSAPASVQRLLLTLTAIK